MGAAFCCCFEKSGVGCDTQWVAQCRRIVTMAPLTPLCVVPQVSRKQAEEFCKKAEIMAEEGDKIWENTYWETSSKENINVHKAFTRVAALALTKLLRAAIEADHETPLNENMVSEKNVLSRDYQFIH